MKLAADACLLVTDDYPAYIVPAQNRAVGAKADVAVHLVDGNGLVPLSLLGPAVSAAAHLRPRIHKQFAEAWGHRAAAEPAVPKAAKGSLDAPFSALVLPSPLAGEGGESSSRVRGKASARKGQPPQSESATPHPQPLSRKGRGEPEPDPLLDFVRSLPIDQSVPPVPGVVGGSVAGRAALAEFVAEKLPRYATDRNQPDDPARNASSRLSTHLHYGHISIQEVAEAVLGPDWTPAEINPAARGKRDDFFTRDPNVNGFLDEAITWRDVGYQWHHFRNAECGMRNAGSKNVSWQASADGVPMFNFETFDCSPGGERTLDVVLPEWARATLRAHERDRREHLYSLAEFEAGTTHDGLWNAAQRELVATGRIHNYLRMLWAKKVLEWTETPAEAYRVLEHLNNKYAVDGRDPNSYTGVLWCFGLFDRPWPPERPVFGTVRFMSSDNTGKKFKLAGYYEYINRLPTIEQVRAGDTALRPGGLF